MIIKATRIQTKSGVGALRRHVFNGKDNDRIILLKGSPDDLDDMFDDAQEHGSKYSARHFTISSKASLSKDNLLKVLTNLKREFEWSQDAYQVLLQHAKKRAAKQSSGHHYHFIVSEVDPIQRRVLSSHKMMKRHEAVCRLSEVQLGHELVKGQHNLFAYHHLKSQGHTKEAEAMKSLIEGDLPLASFTVSQHQNAKRRGVSLPKLKAVILESWAQSDSKRSFCRILDEHDITLSRGKKRGVWIAEKGGSEVALHRIIKSIKKNDLDALLSREVRQNIKSQKVEKSLNSISLEIKEIANELEKRNSDSKDARKHRSLDEPVRRKRKKRGKRPSTTAGPVATNRNGAKPDSTVNRRPSQQGGSPAKTKVKVKAGNGKKRIAKAQKDQSAPINQTLKKIILGYIATIKNAVQGDHIQKQKPQKAIEKQLETPEISADEQLAAMKKRVKQRMLNNMYRQRTPSKQEEHKRQMEQREEEYQQSLSKDNFDAPNNDDTKLPKP